MGEYILSRDEWCNLYDKVTEANTYTSLWDVSGTFVNVSGDVDSTEKQWRLSNKSKNDNDLQSVVTVVRPKSVMLDRLLQAVILKFIKLEKQRVVLNSCEDYNSKQDMFPSKEPQQDDCNRSNDANYTNKVDNKKKNLNNDGLTILSNQIGKGVKDANMSTRSSYTYTNKKSISSFSTTPTHFTNSCSENSTKFKLDNHECLLSMPTGLKEVWINPDASMASKASRNIRKSRKKLIRTSRFCNDSSLCHEVKQRLVEKTCYGDTKTDKTFQKPLKQRQEIQDHFDIQSTLLMLHDDKVVSTRSGGLESKHQDNGKCKNVGVNARFLPELLGSTQELVMDFDTIPTRCTTSNVMYKPQVVRNKQERAQLLGNSCNECEPYLNLLKLKMTTDEFEMVKRRICRHKCKNQVVFSDTPPGYWDTTMPSTAELYEEGFIKVAGVQFSPITIKRKRRNSQGDSQDTNKEW